MRFRPGYLILCCITALVGCTTKAPVDSGETGLQRLPARQSLVVPSNSTRLATLLRGMGEPGSDFGPYAGRRDARLGALSPITERLSSGYSQRILDRQSSNQGRPYNNYSNVTTTRFRVDR